MQAAPAPIRLALREALDKLPPRMRAALSLHYHAGLSVEETAVALGISANTVKYHLKAGLERLRTVLEVRVVQSRTSEPRS